MSEKIDEKYSHYIKRHIESFEVFGNKDKFKYLSAYRNSVYGFRILIEILIKILKILIKNLEISIKILKKSMKK